MRQVLVRPLQDARRRVRDDLREDPYLVYILLFATVLASFWIWHRLPNFATRDERWRVVDPIEAFAALRNELSYEALREGVTYWRSYGATFYVAALVLVPVVIVVFVVGEVTAFADMGRHIGVSYWEHWLRTPGWIWALSVFLLRLVTVALSVGSVYLMYRIGAVTRDRETGRLAAVLLSVTWGFLVLSHEAGEDVPALFLFLLSFYLALRYVEDGASRYLYLSSLVGGLGAAVKLTAGVSSLVIGGAFLLRARREDGSLVDRLFRPKLLATGFGLGVAGILLGYPSFVVGDPSEVGGRISRGVSNKGSPHGWLVQPSWWWILRGYLHGLGLPLTLAAAGSVVANVFTLRSRWRSFEGVVLALVPTAVLLLVYSRWAYVRTHHLLLTFPMLGLVVAVTALRVKETWPSVGRVAVAALLVTSGAYAVGGDLAYASQPRDQSAAWLSERAGPTDQIETYVRDPQEAGVPHDANLSYPFDREMTLDGETIYPGYERWIRLMPERCPKYVVLTYQTSLMHVAPEEWGKRADTLSDDDLSEFYRTLLAEEVGPYEVAERFGRRPRFLDGKERRPTLQAFLRVGVRPRTMQYGDPQDFGVDQYTVILERTSDCSGGERTAADLPGASPAARP